MGMMLLRINLNYHAYNPLVYPISFQFLFTNSALQEDNDQAFPVTL